MKKLVLFFVILSAFQTQAKKGLYCGTRGTLLGILASDFVIPDYFPPESFVARLFVDYSICEENYERINFGSGCYDHDQCYASLGAVKDTCDHDLLEAWKNSCKSGYQDSSEVASYCLNSCLSMADLMYSALRYDDGIFCPSCRAFEKSQKAANN